MLRIFFIEQHPYVFLLDNSLLLLFPIKSIIHICISVVNLIEPFFQNEFLLQWLPILRLKPFKICFKLF